MQVYRIYPPLLLKSFQSDIALRFQSRDQRESVDPNRHSYNPVP